MPNCALGTDSGNRWQRLEGGVWEREAPSLEEVNLKIALQGVGKKVGVGATLPVGQNFWKETEGGGWDMYLA